MYLSLKIKFVKISLQIKIRKTRNKILKECYDSNKKRKEKTDAK